MVENYQAAYLAKLPIDPQTLAGEYPPERLARFELQRYLEYPARIYAPPQSPSTHRHVHGYYDFKAVGFAEEFTASIRRFSKVFQCGDVGQIEPQNVNPARVSARGVGCLYKKLDRNVDRSRSVTLLFR